MFCLFENLGSGVDRDRGVSEQDRGILVRMSHRFLLRSHESRRGLRRAARRDPQRTGSARAIEPQTLRAIAFCWLAASGKFRRFESLKTAVGEPDSGGARARLLVSTMVMAVVDTLRAEI